MKLFKRSADDVAGYRLPYRGSKPLRQPAVRQQRPHPAIHCFGHNNECTRGTTYFGTGDHFPSDSNAEVVANSYKWSGQGESNSYINLGKVSSYLYIMPALNYLFSHQSKLEIIG